MFGFSIFTALTIPNWLRNNPDSLKTGTCSIFLYTLDHGVFEDPELDVFFFFFVF